MNSAYINSQLAERSRNECCKKFEQIEIKVGIYRINHKTNYITLTLALIFLMANFNLNHIDIDIGHLIYITQMVIT